MFAVLINDLACIDNSLSGRSGDEEAEQDGRDGEEGKKTRQKKV